MASATRQCKGCDTVFEPSPRERRRKEFCEKECGQAYHRAVANPHHAPRSGETHRSCASCGGIFDVSPLETRRRLYCNQACRIKDYRKNNPDYVAASNLQSAARAKARHVPPAYDRHCPQCQAFFQAKRSNVMYCGKTCRDRAFSLARQADGRKADQSAVRRALEVGAKITAGRRAAVYERDALVCQLCGLPTNPALRHPKSLAPVIDHRVALTRGGAHGPANWQTAHSYCNSRKLALSMDEFRAAYPSITEQVRTLIGV